MNIFSGMKKRLTVFALAMAMFASILCGVLFIGARAEAFTASSLITAGAGVTVTQGDADAKYTMADGTQVPNPGLFIETAAANSAGVGFSLNGIFTGSLGLEMWSPGEGLADIQKNLVITVASVADPDTYFEVYMEGSNRLTGYVKYVEDGVAYYRTKQYADQTVYQYSENASKTNNASCMLPDFNWYNKDANSHYKADGGNEGYFGIHKSAIDGSENYRYDVVLNHGYAQHMTIASFGSQTFNKSTEGSGADSDLPVLDLSEGYTVAFALSDASDTYSINLLFPTMAVSETGDPYTAGTVYTLSETIAEAPAFYTAWQEAEADEGIDAAAFFSVSGDAQLLSSPQQYTMKNDSKESVTLAGTKVGDTGLYIQSTANKSTDGYTVDVNGIFKGSTGMYLAFPGEGFGGGAEYREVVITVASVTDPDEKFNVHLYGQWDTSADVSFDYNGTTLWRSRSSFPVWDGYDFATGADNQEWNYTKSTHYYYPKVGDYQNNPTSAEPWHRATYFGLEMRDNGVLNVVLMANGGASGQPFKRVVASFAEEPTSFVPQTSDKGSTPNLPRLTSFANGYTISFHISDQADEKAVDMLVKSIATREEGGDAYLDDGGQVYTFKSTSKYEVPDFYTRWQNVPVITVADDDFDAVQPVNEEIILPEATYTTRVSDDPKTVTDISYKFGDGDWQPATDGKFTPDQAGVYTVRYLVDGVYSAQIEITVRDDVTFAETQLEKLVRVSDNATAKANAQYKVGDDPYRPGDPPPKDYKYAPEEVGTPIGDPGLLVTPNNFEAQDPYTVDLVGVFEGNTAIEWSVPGENWSNASNVIFTIADVADPSNSFQVIWTGANQSPAYVCYNYPGRDGVPAQQLLRVSNGSDTSYAMYDGTRPGEGDDETQFGRIGDNWFAKFKPYKGAWNTVSERTPGLLSLEWTEDGELNIVALNDMGTPIVMASFCEEPETFVPVDTDATKTKKGLDYNLPKLTFEHGYTISVKVTSNAMFMLFDVTTGGETTSFAADSQNYEPAFYTQGKQIPVFGEVQTIADVALGTEVTVPALGYETYGGTPGTVSDIKWGPVGGDMTAVTDNKFTVTGEGGDYVVRYTVTALGADFVKEVTFHACNYTTPGKVNNEATCTTDGDGWFSCEHGNSIVLTIPATGHTYGEPTWEWDGVTEATATFTCTNEDCGHQETAVAEGDAITNAVTTPATCTEAGVRTYTATVTVAFGDGTYTGTKEETISVDPNAHDATLVHVEGKAATCSEAGVKEHYKCESCGATFEDADGETAMADTTIPVDPDAHDATLVRVEGKAATCTEAGVKEHYKCGSCGATFEDAAGKTAMADTTIPAKGHNMQKVEAVAPTCEAGGNSEYYECSVCHKQFKDAAGKTETTAEKCALKPLGHNVKKVDGKAATCTEDGNSGYYKCENCGACYSDSKGEMNIDESSMIRKATGHKYENGVCTVCGAADPAAAEDEGGCGSAVSVAGVSVLLAGAVLAAAGGLFLGRKKRS